MAMINLQEIFVGSHYILATNVIRLHLSRKSEEEKNKLSNEIWMYPSNKSRVSKTV